MAAFIEIETVADEELTVNLDTVANITPNPDPQSGGPDNTILTFTGGYAPDGSKECLLKEGYQTLKQQILDAAK